MKKTLFVTLAIAIALFSFPVNGFALSCADKVVCFHITPNLDTADYHRVGEINTPTCWKIFHHCRPWHCDGYKSTNDEYWKNECIKRFPVLQGKEVRVKYPN
ncbi:MAG: hypothetical protein K4571_14400 [Deltaproteobacteria bacterium]